MSGFTFSKATATQSRLRLALIGPAGSGKTYSALNIGQHLGQRVAVIDTERGSASKYAKLFNFDVLELTDFAPQTYVSAIQAADAAGYDVLIIDSLTHAWSGKGGALEQVDAAAKRDTRGNSFTAWRDVTPKHNAMVDTILGCRAHVIATIRAKTEFVVEKDERGKSTPRKIGMAPIQRDGMEYEFDVVGDMDQSNTLIVSKSRCPALNGAVIEKPGADVAQVLKEWLSDGAPMPAVTPRPDPPVSHPIESTIVRPTGETIQIAPTPEQETLDGIRQRMDENPGNFMPPPGEQLSMESAPTPNVAPPPSLVAQFDKRMKEASALPNFDVGAFECRTSEMTAPQLSALDQKLKRAIDAAKQTAGAR